MDRKISIAFQDVGKKRHNFESWKSLSDFLLQEHDFWKKNFESMKEPQGQTSHLFSAYKHFRNAVDQIKAWQERISDWSDEDVNNAINSLKVNQLSGIESQWLWSGHPYTKNYIECHRAHGQLAADAFFRLVVAGNIREIKDKASFMGVMAGYEYLAQGAEMLKRSKGEKASLERLRARLVEATDKLFGEIDEKKSGFNEWEDSQKESWAAFVRETRDGYRDSQSHREKQFDDYIKNCEVRIATLENTYQDKLRLEKPAEYWKKAAVKYRRQGGWWTFALVSMLIAGTVGFGRFFFLWLQGQKIVLALNTLEGAVLFAAILAVFVFLIKTLSRLAFSAYHLQRDAEEREQLTYVYLALTQEKDVSEASLHIVLQALFSRSETGLLGNEHGPVMPTVTDAIRGAGFLGRHHQP